MKRTPLRQVVVASVFLLGISLGSPEMEFPLNFNGVSENQTNEFGYYYMITGGKFPTGNPPNGDNGSTVNGDTFRFVTDDSVAWRRPIGESGVRQKDDWFPENTSFAMTIKNGSDIVYGTTAYLLLHWSPCDGPGDGLVNRKPSCGAL